MDHGNERRYHKNWIVIGAMAIGLLFIMGGSAFARGSYLNSFNTTYGTAATKLNTCNLCHPGGNTSQFTSYGDDYRNNSRSFSAIELLDSDGDGSTNIVEITANPPTFPGDGNDFPPPPPPVNNPPVADAGPNQTVAASSGGTASVTLNGSSSSDPDAGDSIASYSWSGPFGKVTGASPTVTLGIGVHTVTLTVQDTHGATGIDTVQVTVNEAPPPPPPGNAPPTANAGPDQTVTAGPGGTASVTLNGSGSSDPDAGDSIASYSWSGPFGTVTGASPTVTLGIGVHTVTLAVQDTNGATGTDTVQVTVDPETPAPPPATGEISVTPEDGAADISVTAAITITMNGFATNLTAASSPDISTVVNEDTFTLEVDSPVKVDSSYGDYEDEHSQCVTNGIVNGTIAYDDLRTAATFTPLCKLGKSTTYTATIIPVAGAQSVLERPFSWSFSTVAESPDTDGDGADDVEDEKPDDDREASFRKAKGKGKIRVGVRNHGKAYLRHVEGISDTHASISQAGKPAGYEFPDGLADYEIHGISPGDSVEVELTFPEAIPAGSKVYMADAHGFRELPAFLSGTSVVLTLTDGGQGDQDGTADGVIVDPVGVAVPAAGGSGTVDLGTGASGGGCSVVGTGGGWKEAAGSHGLLAIVWVGLALRRGKTKTGK